MGTGQTKWRMSVGRQPRESFRQSPTASLLTLPCHPDRILYRFVLPLVLFLIGFGAPFSALSRDLSLIEAEQLVNKPTRDVLAARRAIEAANAGILQADVRPNPVISYNAASIGSHIGPGTITDKRIDNTFRVDQLIERGNKRE